MNVTVRLAPRLPGEARAPITTRVGRTVDRTQFIAETIDNSHVADAFTSVSDRSGVGLPFGRSLVEKPQAAIELQGLGVHHTVERLSVQREPAEVRIGLELTDLGPRVPAVPNHEVLLRLAETDRCDAWSSRN